MMINRSYGNCYFFERNNSKFRIILKLIQIFRFTLASENDSLASAAFPEYSNVGVPLSSSTLKQDDLNPDIRENPEGQSIGAYPQTKGFPRAQREVFHLKLCTKGKKYVFIISYILMVKNI